MVLAVLGRWGARCWGAAWFAGAGGSLLLWSSCFESLVNCLMLAPCQVMPCVQQPGPEAPDTRLLRSRWLVVGAGLPLLLCCWLLVPAPILP